MCVAAQQLTEGKAWCAIINLLLTVLPQRGGKQEKKAKSLKTQTMLWAVAGAEVNNRLLGIWSRNIFPGLSTTREIATCQR